MRGPPARQVLRAALAAALGALLLPAGAHALASNNPDNSAFEANGAVRTVQPAGDLTYIGGEFTQLRAHTGGFATLSRESGRRTGSSPDVEPNFGDVNAVVPDGAGGVYIGGDFTKVGGVSRENVAHIVADGTVDPNFDVGDPDGVVHALALVGPALYVGGAFTTIGGLNRNNIAKLSATSGNAVSTWDPNASGLVRALAVSGSDVYVGGDFNGANSIGGQSRNRIAKLSATSGNAFSAWDPDASNSVVALVVVDGVVYAGGFFNTIGGLTRPNLAKLSATSGDAFSVFNAGADSDVDAFALSDSGLYVGGNFTQIGGQPRNRLAKLSTANGNAFSGWNPNADSYVSALVLADDTVFVGGNFGNVGGRPRNRFAKLSATSGNAFSAFDPSPDGDVVSLAVSGPRVFASGVFTSVNPVTRNRIAALDANGVPTAWNPSADDDVLDIEVSDDGGEVFAVGDFTQIGGLNRELIAKLSAASGNAFSGFDPDPGGIARVAVLREPALYVGGQFSQGGDGTTANNNLAKYSADTGNVFTGFQPNPTDAVFNVPGLAVGSDGAVYAGGNFEAADMIGGREREKIAKLSGTTGNAFSAWNPGANLPVGALEAVGSTLYVGGDFNGASSIGGMARNYIARLSTSTGNVAAWDPNANSSVFAIAPFGSEVYAGGLFTMIGGQARNRIAVLSGTSGLAFNAFAPSPNGIFVSDVEATSSKLYVGGDFTEISERPRQGYAQFSQP